jgi:hypothetical protein
VTADVVCKINSFIPILLNEQIRGQLEQSQVRKKRKSDVRKQGEKRQIEKKAKAK